jgi:hypothetical protein
MSGELNRLGIIKFFADQVGANLLALNLGWPAVFALLNVSYFGLHYMFASQTAHVGALYAAFLAMMLAAGTRIDFGLCLVVFTCLCFGQKPVSLPFEASGHDQFVRDACPRLCPSLTLLLGRPLTFCYSLQRSTWYLVGTKGLLVRSHALEALTSRALLCHFWSSCVHVER